MGVGLQLKWETEMGQLRFWATWLGDYLYLFLDLWTPGTREPSGRGGFRAGRRWMDATDEMRAGTSPAFEEAETIGRLSDWHGLGQCSQAAELPATSGLPRVGGVTDAFGNL